MDNSSEKKYVYEQMKLIIEERRGLTKQYYELKERLAVIDHLKFETRNNDNSMATENKKVDIIKVESEYQRYMLSKETNQPKNISYQKIGLTISSILKEAGRPLSNKEIFNILNESSELEVNYKNLTANILPKMHRDTQMNVERSYRGYWQYRLTKI